VLYERNGYSEIVFARLDPQGLSARALESAAAAYRDNDGGSFAMVLRSITPGRPETWVNVGDTHVISASAGTWGVHTWKEIGQGYGDGEQELGTREAQDVNYGTPAPGLRAGDILAFTGRFRNQGKAPIRVKLAGNFDGDITKAFPPVDLASGAETLYFTPTYTVTAPDVALGRAIVECAVVSGSDRWERTFLADTATGLVSEMVKQ
jgi:sialidase-1